MSHNHWFAAQVRSRHEKFVANQLQSQDVQCYVPLVRKKHKDRTYTENVLIPGYCFVDAEAAQHRVVLATVGVCGFVTFQNEPAEIPQSEIDFLREATHPKFMAKEYTGFVHRQAVRIVGTPFDGYIATVDYVSGSRVRVILPMSIGRSVSVELEAMNVEPLQASTDAKMFEIPFGVN